jgi:chromosome segregation ATPase
MSMFDERDQECFENWMRDENSDAAFCCYIASRIYLLLITRRHCDLVVDVASLGNSARRGETGAALSRLLGVSVDLENFKQRVDYPKRIIQSPADCRKMINELLERCLSEIDATGDERDYGHQLVEATWDAHASFMAYTSGARELIEQDAQRIVEMGAAMASLTSRLRELVDQVARYEREAAALRRGAEGRRLQAEAAEAHLRACRQEIATLEARLADAQRQSS